MLSEGTNQTVIVFRVRIVCSFEEEDSLENLRTLSCVAWLKSILFNLLCMFVGFFFNVFFRMPADPEQTRGSREHLENFEEVFFLQTTYNIKTEKQTNHLAYVSLMLGCWQKEKGRRLT